MMSKTAISHEIRGEVAIIRVHGALEMPLAEELKPAILTLLDRPSVLAAVFVLSEVPLVDSAGLGLFIGLHRKYQGRKLIRYCGLSPSVHAVFTYSRLLDSFEIDASLEDSLASLGHPEGAARQPEGRAPVGAPAVDDRLIELPARYILTELGQRYCGQQRIPLKDLKMASGDRATGFEWSRCRVGVMRKLVVHDLVTTMEIGRPEFVTRRRELIELLRTILGGIVIKRFKPELTARLRERPEVRAIVGDAARAAVFRDRARLQAELARNASWSETLVATIKAECDHDLAHAARECEDDEARSVDELIAAIDDEARYLLAQGGPDLVGEAVKVVLSYRRRMDITEHLALMLMEFIQVAEKSFLLNLAERELYLRSHPEEIERMLGERDFRERLLSKAEERGELVVFRVSFFGTVLDPRDTSRVEIAIRNRGLVGYASRQEVMARRQRMVKENRLDEILRAESARADALSGEGSGLAVVYHSRIVEACAREGMSFEGSVIRDETRDETVTTVSLSL